MRKFLTFFATLLFFASVTVFTLPMMQNDASAGLSLTEKVTIMAKADEIIGYKCYSVIEFVGGSQGEPLLFCRDCMPRVGYIGIGMTSTCFPEE